MSQGLLYYKVMCFSAYPKHRPAWSRVNIVLPLNPDCNPTSPCLSDSFILLPRFIISWVTLIPKIIAFDQFPVVILFPSVYIGIDIDIFTLNVEKGLYPVGFFI